MAESRNLPYPPPRLMQRVGRLRVSDDELVAAYDRFGGLLADAIVGWLPDDWSWEGARVVDFGCGAGRVLRHFARWADVASIVGYDIDQESIAWLHANLGMIDARTCGELPGLPERDGSVDLVLALSVFSHLTEHSAGWLLELHRMLRPGGTAIISVLNRGSWQDNVPGGPPWVDDEVGMLVLNPLNPWDTGGPTVFLSEWWIREHWGRAFDIEWFVPERVVEPPPGMRGQGAVLLRKRDVVITPDQLLAPNPADPREASCLRTNEVALLNAVSVARSHIEQLTDSVGQLRADLERQQRLAQSLAARLDDVTSSQR